MRHRLMSIVGTAVVGLLAPIALPANVTAETAIETDQPPKADPAPEVIESDTGSYIVVMIDDPLVASIPVDDLDTPVAEAEAAALEAEHDQVLAESGISTSEKIQGFTNALNGFAATLSYEQALKVASNPDVAAVLPDELRQLTTDSSGEFLGLTGRGRAWESGLTGEGVVVGVIDSGIWPEHPSFADDGSYAAPPVTLEDTPANPACNFGNAAHNADDVPFTCNNKLVGARQMIATYRALIGADPDEFDSARDDDGHGTHTASTAAGNAGVAASIFGKDYGEISGIAPRAHVIAYKGLGRLGGFTSDLTAAIDQAVADGVDVINYSVGGGANLISADAIAYLFAADAGVWVATSAGNSGPGPDTIGGPADVPWITTVAASTQERFLRGTVILSGKHIDAGRWSWPERLRVFGASITPALDGRAGVVDAEFAGGDLCIPGTLDPALVDGKVVLCRRGAIARAAKSLAVFEAGGAGMVLYNNDDDDNLFTDSHWVPSVHVDNTTGLELKEFIATHNTMARIRGTGTSTRVDYAPSTAYFSSRGPNSTSADIIKPDITAPGVQILAGASPFNEPGSTVPGELFQAIAGTSMSSPHVAGIYALLKQAHPDWTPAAAKSAIMTTAHQDVRDDDGSTFADPFDMGAGHLDVGRVAQRGSIFNPGLVYDAGFLDYLGFLCDAAPEIFTDADATCGGLAASGIPTDASDLNLASIAVAELAGTQTIQRTVTSVADRTTQYWAEYEAPPGYDVYANPSSFVIAPGETVTYELTIDNNGGGVVGEWAFGAIKWKSAAGWDARSPIAVRGAALNAPAAISGEGETGSASFDVQFGYTGDYAAAPHGLVPEVLLSGTVSQDPDQTYTPGETSPGVVLESFPLSGAAFARIELVIPGPDDIDLFLEDSSGNIVAQSTSGGTDEHIELTLPADDNYTLVVHGWSVPNEPLAYDISTWVVPLASGGSLSVDSAPASAVVGGFGTIDVSWTGVPAGSHLGAVSHSDASGLVGLTLVEVDVAAAP